MNPDEEPQYPSLLEAAAYLGLNPDTLRSHLIRSGHPPLVRYRPSGRGNSGRAYLPMSLEDADKLVRSRQQATLDRRRAIEELPGLSAQRVADLLGIQAQTVYRLNQLQYLPAEQEVQVGKQKLLRWSLSTVKAYAQRRGRTLVASEMP